MADSDNYMLWSNSIDYVINNKIETIYDNINGHVEIKFDECTIIHVLDKKTQNNYYYFDSDVSNIKKYSNMMKDCTESYKDILEKSYHILRGEEYDKRVVISIDFTEEEKNNIEKAAELKGITPEEFIVMVLENFLKDDLNDKGSDGSTGI